MRYSGAMDRERVNQALARIEGAFSRAEAAAARPRVSVPAAALVEQNMRLRDTIGDMLGELDTLIERLEP